MRPPISNSQAQQALPINRGRSRRFVSANGWMAAKLKDTLQFCAAAGIMALLIVPLTLAAIGLWIYINLPDWPRLDER